MDEIDEGLKAQTYRELVWLCFQEWSGGQWHKREPQRQIGWAAHAYHEIFRSWPPQWMKQLHPHEPSEALRKLMTSRDSLYKRTVQYAGQTDAKVPGRGGAAGGGDGSEGAAVDAGIRHRRGQD